MQYEPGQTLFLEVSACDTDSVVTCDSCCVVWILLDGWETCQVGQGLCRMTINSMCRTVLHGFTNHHVCHH